MYKIVHIFVYHSIKVPVSVQFCTNFGVIFGAHAHVLQKCHSATPQMQLEEAQADSKTLEQQVGCGELQILNRRGCCFTATCA